MAFGHGHKALRLAVWHDNGLGSRIMVFAVLKYLDVPSVTVPGLRRNHDDDFFFLSSTSSILSSGISLYFSSRNSSISSLTSP